MLVLYLEIIPTFFLSPTFQTTNQNIHGTYKIQSSTLLIYSTCMPTQLTNDFWQFAIKLKQSKPDISKTNKLATEDVNQ